MKAVLEAFGWLLVLQGIGGLINTLFGWWRWAHGLLVVNVLPFLDGYEVFAAVVLGVLGFALLAVAGAVGRTAGGAEEGR
ncbi:MULTISPECIES: hypothetical protein [unclassified Nonomuraea]|uniref:hypothetical protein n=1 Tax=unclassified Nonomuraea TaxID=2593643 RepID=UPI003407E482